MELENRYIVIKRTDAEKYLSNEGRDALSTALYIIEKGRQFEGKPPLTGLHIESDWPEYEPTKAALLARINGAAETLEEIQAAELARSRFNTEKRTPPGVESSGHVEWEAPARQSVHDVRIGGPGSIDPEREKQWDADAKVAIERLAKRRKKATTPQGD